MKINSRATLALLVVLSMGIFGGCKGDPASPKVLTTLTVNVSPTAVPIGKSAQATVVGLDQFGRAMEAGPVTWSSSRLVSISQSGVVTGVSLGRADVIAVAGDHVGTATITVTAKSAARLVTTAAASDAERNGVKLVLQPPVRLVDDDGVPVRQDGVPVTATLTSGGGTLSGITTVATNFEGFAPFLNLAVTGTSGIKTITLSSPGLVSATYQFTLVSGVASNLTITGGNNQSPVIKNGTAALSVQVLDADGYPVSGVPVSWAVASGGGTLGVTSTSTTTDGVASNETWRVGAFGINTVTATVAGVTLPVTFTANAEHAVTSGLLTLSSPTVAIGQSIQASVKIFDETGAPFTPTAAPQWFAPGQVAVQTGLIIGAFAGDTYVYVRSGGLTLQAPLKVTGIATRKLTVSKAPVSAISGAPLNPQPVVQLVDVATGQPVREAGHPVTFNTFGSASLVGTTTVLTDANGTARFTDVGIVLNPGITGGGDLLFYTDDALPIDWLRFPILANVPAQFTIVQAASQSGFAGKPVTAKPAVVVRDATGNPVGAGIPVTFTASAGGSVTPSTAITNAGGYVEVETWTLGAVGLNTLTVTSRAFAGSVTFRATARPF